jgi:hypothetical protein
MVPNEKPGEVAPDFRGDDGHDRACSRATLTAASIVLTDRLFTSVLRSGTLGPLSPHCHAENQGPGKQSRAQHVENEQNPASAFHQALLSEMKVKVGTQVESQGFERLADVGENGRRRYKAESFTTTSKPTPGGALTQIMGASLPATTHSLFLSAMLVAGICRFGIGGL